MLKYETELKQVSMKSFYAETASDFTIITCRIDSEDCSQDWQTIYIEQGVCKQYHPYSGNSLKIGKPSLLGSPEGKKSRPIRKRINPDRERKGARLKICGKQDFANSENFRFLMFSVNI